MEIGWYRTLIRSFERELYVVPNSVFSRTVVLNVTRKGKEWRVFEFVGVRVEDMDAVPNIVSDMRVIIRQV
jgi:mechanosensitive ion channel protein 1/2/3